MRLTNQQINYFKTFGYLVFKNLFANEISEITQGFERVWSGIGGGHHGIKHDKKQRSAVLPFIDKDKYLSALLDNEAVDGIASSILGDDYNYASSDGNFYVGDTGWHSDGYTRKKYLSIKMAMYLDPVTVDTGCLRVIPGSHNIGDVFSESLQEASRTSKEQKQKELWGITGVDVPAVALESIPGDLVVFNHRIKHSSFGGWHSRRMFTMNFSDRYLDEDLSLLKDDIGNLARFWTERAYGKVMIETAGKSRMKHLEQRLANDDHLVDLVLKAKSEMNEPARG